jgi:hypothetical protein
MTFGEDGFASVSPARAAPEIATAPPARDVDKEFARGFADP